MRHIIFTLITICSILFNIGAAHAGDWVFIKERDGIRVYKKSVDGTPFGAFKGEGDIEAPIQKVASVIFDNSRAPEWVDNLKESRVLHWNSEDEYVQYNYINTPFVIKDRDFVSKVKINIEPGGKKMTFVSNGVVDPMMPEREAVRGQVIRSVYTLESKDNDTKTHVIGEILADPKGSVPSWIVNLFQVDWPINSLKAMRKQVKRPDIAVHEKLKPLFQKAESPSAGGPAKNAKK